jgi:hypothetical protein
MGASAVAWLAHHETFTDVSGVRKQLGILFRAETGETEG